MDIRHSRRACEASLTEFIRQAWHLVEQGAPYVHGWHIDAMAEHLEAVGEGEITRLLINIPPGMMKSLLVSVFWPSWLWTKNPSLRFLCASHSQDLAIRDSAKMRRLIQSEWYLRRWPNVKLTGDQNAKTKFETVQGGFRQAIAAGSITGARADHVIIDDPHSVESAASEAMRATTAEWFLEAVPTRLNNPISSSIVVIMQRLHEEDVSGLIVDKQLGYEHLMLPMEFDSARKCETSIGFSDPRTEEGELLFPERFPRDVVERDKRVMGPYASAGQFDQRPTPRGGGIIKREWWGLWDDDEAVSQGVNSGASYPAFDFVLASVDTAYSEKQEADFSALTVWGVWSRGGSVAKTILNHKGTRTELISDQDALPCAMLMYAWQKKLPIHGPDVLRLNGEDEATYRKRAQQSWGLCEWIADSCRRYRVDKLLIEAKASGISVAQEIKRLYRTEDWGVELINPGSLDKVSRVYAVQPIFSNNQVFAPERSWSDAVITQFESFPKGKHDDMVDAAVQGLKWMRERGLLSRSEDIAATIAEKTTYRRPVRPVYEV